MFSGVCCLAQYHNCGHSDCCPNSEVYYKASITTKKFFDKKYINTPKTPQEVYAKHQAKSNPYAPMDWKFAALSREEQDKIMAEKMAKLHFTPLHI